MTLLERSFSGAVLILVIILFRALFLERLPKRTFLALWTVAVMRLLLPITVPSALSAYSWLPHNFAEQELAAPEIRRLPLAEAKTSADQIPADPAPLREYADVSVWWLVWGAGSLFAASFFAASYLRCRLEFRNSLPVDQPFAQEWWEAHPLKRRVQVRQLDRLSAPLTYGVLRPVLLLPSTTDWNARERLSYVFLHEYIHIRRFDTIRKLLLAATLCIHWFNPLVWALYALCSRDLELFCDEQVVRMLGREVRADYARALIDMEEIKSGLRPLCSGFSKTAIEERIKAIMKLKKLTVSAVVAALALIVGVTSVFATSAAAKTAIPAAYAGESGGNDIKPQPELSELLPEYAPFGVTEKDGHIYFRGELVRYFLDGYEREENTISRYEAYNSKGTVDVHTVRRDKRNADGSTELFGPISDIVAYSQEEFDRREFAFVMRDETAVEETSAAFETDTETVENDVASATLIEAIAQENEGDEEISYETATAEAQETQISGTTFPEIFKAYAPYGIDYVEEKGASGRGNVSYKGKSVKTFVDVSPRKVFTFQSADGGEWNVKTIYNKDGKLTGIETLTDQDLEDLLLHVQAHRESASAWQEVLAPYVPLGLTYAYDPTGDDENGNLTMSFQGKEVRGIMDEETGIWITEHTGRTAYGADAVELYAVYQNGTLAGLREATRAEQKEWDSVRNQAQKAVETE